ncbi:MAG: TetR/AcrR family transcriptional regulator [Bacteroidales bacterium]|nr:TetR/AcrR family transcriptional regulator [Bacteroidales bacterium]
MDKEYKYNEIIQEARQLFQRYGIKSISMDELSRQLGISKKTLYLHFTDKNDLVEKTLLHMTNEKECAMKEMHNKDLNAVEELFEMFSYANEMIRNHNPSMEFDLQKFYPHIFKRLRDFHRNNMYEATLKNLLKGKNEGYYRNDLNEEIISKLFVLRIENLMHSDMVTLEEIHSDKFFKEVFKYHMFGIISPQGLQFIQSKYQEFLTNE